MKTNYLRAVAVTTLLVLGLTLGACGERTNREDFVTMIKSKTEQDVLKNIGKPASVDDKSPDRHVWTYTSRTFDITHGNKMDDKTIVIFTPNTEGKWVVAEVKFE